MKLKLPSFLLFLPVLLLLAPLARWLQHQHDLQFFLGLSSSFWAGVSMGISIVGGLVFIAFVVLHLVSHTASAPGHQGDEP
jgi:hypothetical protein